MEHALARGLPAGPREQRARAARSRPAPVRAETTSAVGPARRDPVAGATASALLNTSRIRAGGNRGGQPLGDARLAGVVAGLAEPRQVAQPQHRVGLADRRPGAGDADRLDRVAGLAQAGGVGHVHRHAFDLDRLADLVARGAGNVGDDRQLGPGQGIEQRALADVRLAGEDDADAFAQQRALARRRQHRGELRVRLGEPAARAGPLEELDLLLGEVERRLDQQAQLDDLLGEQRRSRARTRRRASAPPIAPPPRCWRRSGRPRPRPAPGRACR